MIPPHPSGQLALCLVCEFGSSEQLNTWVQTLSDKTLFILSSEVIVKQNPPISESDLGLSAGGATRYSTCQTHTECAWIYTENVKTLQSSGRRLFLTATSALDSLAAVPTESHREQSSKDVPGLPNTFTTEAENSQDSFIICDRPTGGS